MVETAKSEVLARAILEPREAMVPPMEWVGGKGEEERT